MANAPKRFAEMTGAEERRFWPKVAKGDGCWEWTGSRTPGGYGQFSNANRKLVAAHRWLWERTIGPIEAGMQLDHLCRNRACVRPDHLEPVTPRENTVRGWVARGTHLHCRRGHPRRPENTHVRPNGERYCMECKRERDRAAYHRTKDMRATA